MSNIHSKINDNYLTKQHQDKSTIFIPRYKQLSWPSFFQHFAWIWMRLFMVIFCRVNIKGEQNLKEIKGNVIIASNHSNEFDPIFIVAALPFFSHILPLAYVSRSKDFYAHMPRGFLFGGKFFEMMGAYPVYPGLNNYERSLKHHIDAINVGRSVAIFPVGKRHTMAEISDARGGVSYLAHKTGLPVLPMRIDGVGGSLKLSDYLTFKCRMNVVFGKPIYAKDIFDKNIDPNVMESHQACEKAALAVMNTIKKL